MKHAQYLILNLLSITALAIAVWLAVQNLSVWVPVQVLIWNLPEVSLGGLLGLSALLGALCLGFRMLITLQAGQSEVRKANRDRERTEILAEESSCQVKALEAKVQTLEKALQEALKATK